MLHYYLMITFFTARNVLSDKSFTLVVDTTVSMRYEIDILKYNIESVIQTARKRDFADYILLPFDDSDVHPYLKTSDPDYLVDLVQLIEVSGGQDCPEDSLAAIEKALQVSKPESYIYVFTDAEGKNPKRLSSIQQLCQTLKSQVIIFECGKCEPSNPPYFENVHTYYDIAKYCGGLVLNFHLGNLHHAFKFMKETIKVEWSNIHSYTEFSGCKNFTYVLDTYTKDFMVAVSGNYPTVSITNSYGDNLKTENVVEAYALLVIRVVDPGVGELTTHVSSTGTTIATFYTKKEITFKVGFSPMRPRNLLETSSKPLPDASSYMLISLPSDVAVDVIGVELHMTDMEIIAVGFQAVEEQRNLYIAEVFIAAGRPFKVFIKTQDILTGENVTGYSTTLEPQKFVSGLQNIAPLVEILEPESTIINFEASYTAACKVISDSKPDIKWETEAGEELVSKTALLEIPSTYISYMRLDKATSNMTISCICKNEDGEDSNRIYIYVNRTLIFEVIQSPTDTTVEFGKEGHLICEADTYPLADIKWYHNDTLIEELENVEIVRDEHMLLIKNMGIDDAGVYKCEIVNSIKSESFSANVYITGLELPEIEVEVTEILLKPGDFTEEDCVVLKGIPVPEVTWKYKLQNGDLDNLPDGVIVDDKSLKISAAETTHGGFYVCEAVNLLGIDTQEINVKVQYPPKINNTDETRTVREGELVELTCDVDAVPKATVNWDQYQDDVIIAFDDRHHTDDQHTHRFTARYNDSGQYHCIAANEMGRAIRTVTLNVLVEPYIEPLPWETLTVRSGTTLILPCNVTFGNPVPSTKWEFISPIFQNTVLLRGHAMGSLDLVLNNVTRRHEGTYQCVSENIVKPDTVKVYLKVWN